MRLFSPIPADDMQRLLRRSVEEGVAARSVEALTTGVFLIGLALHLGASNSMVGLLGAIPFLSNLFQLPAIFLVERIRDRRLIVSVCSLVARSFLLLVAVAPFLSNRAHGLWLVVLAVTLRYSIGAFSSCAWNSWVRDLVPKRLLGHFFSRRMVWINLSAAFTSFTAAFFIDMWSKHYMVSTGISSYSFLYVLAFFMGVISSLLVSTLPHPEMRSSELENYQSEIKLSYLLKPLRDTNFRAFLMFMMQWNFAINLAAPFFGVYMLKTLGYDMTLVVLMTVLSQFTNVVALRLWGYYADRYSNKTILKICAPLFVFCILGWMYSAFPENRLLTLAIVAVLHMLMGVSTAGMSLCTSNIALKLSPSRHATGYLALNSLLTSFAAGIAPLIGGVFADYFEDKTLSFDLHWRAGAEDIFIQTFSIHHWGFFFLMAFVLGLISIYRLRHIVEEGDVHERAVIRDIMFDTGKVLRTLSSVAGLREMVMNPMAMVVGLLSRRKR